ncbi:hypothetical protein AB0D30_15405 [Streptomyces sp. NPDC048409]|uniref:hypothetical protein n=1 Tax=unclassified Streptomyces TaxID=2593676 RepID=UPI003325AEEE
MIKQVMHHSSGDNPAGFDLALEVAYELNAPSATPAPAPRVPEIVPAPELMGLRVTAARTHQRKVPLSRMTLVRG